LKFVSHSSNLNYSIYSIQVPHAFQEVLGAEKIPTLCYSIPAFASFIDMWEKPMQDHPEWKKYIQPGLDKLEDYKNTVDDTPAYVVAMGITSYFLLY
jgi:hypothetical protein